MEFVSKVNREKITFLFEKWRKPLILSYLQGYNGNAWSDSLENTTSAQVVVGDFCFFAGEANLELMRHIPADFSSEFILMVPQHQGWATYIEQAYQTAAEKIFRYGIGEIPPLFDREKLQFYIEQLPQEYSLDGIDEKRYDQLRKSLVQRFMCAI